MGPPLLVTIGIMGVSLAGAAFAVTWMVVGVVTLSRGRAVINLRNISWSAEEARWIGVCMIFQGVVIGSWDILGMLIFIAPVVPVFWAGQKWELIAIQGTSGLIFFSTLLAQAFIELRNGKRERLQARY